METTQIRSDANHDAALREIETLWGAGAGTPERERLDALVTLVDEYEDKRWPVAPDCRT